MKTEAMLAFEKLFSDCEFDFTVSQLGGYEDYNTGVTFGMFSIGYDAGNYKGLTTGLKEGYTMAVNDCWVAGVETTWSKEE